MVDLMGTSVSFRRKKKDILFWFYKKGKGANYDKNKNRNSFEKNE